MFLYALYIQSIILKPPIICTTYGVVAYAPYIPSTMLKPPTLCTTYVVVCSKHPKYHVKTPNTMYYLCHCILVHTKYLVKTPNSMY